MKERGNPNCAETHATFRITGDQLDPDAITKLLGIEPSFGWRKGDVHGHPTRPVRSPTGIWAVESKAAVSSTILEEHLAYLLDRIGEPDPSFRSYLRDHDLKPDFFCYWMSATGQGGPAISPGTLKRVADVGADFNFDIYFVGEDGEKEDSA